MQPAAVSTDSLGCGCHDSLSVFWHSHTIVMALKLSPVPCIRRNCITKWCFNFIYTLSLPFLPVFQCFWRVQNSSYKIITCCQGLACDSRLEIKLAKFYWLQLQLQLQPKWQILTSFHSSLDSDSEALPRRALNNWECTDHPGQTA